MQEDMTLHLILVMEIVLLGDIQNMLDMAQHLEFLELDLEIFNKLMEAGVRLQLKQKLTLLNLQEHMLLQELLQPDIIQEKITVMDIEIIAVMEVLLIHILLSEHTLLLGLPELLIQLDLQDILIQPELGLPLVHLLM